jgi:DNA-binding response OmpR family regulator
LRVASARILLIEPDEATQATVESALDGRGYEILKALDGEEGLQSAVTNTPDVMRRSAGAAN